MSEFRDYKGTTPTEVKPKTRGSGMMFPFLAVIVALVVLAVIYAMATRGDGSMTSAPNVAPTAPIQAPTQGEETTAPSPLKPTAPVEQAPAPAPAMDSAPSTTPSTTPAPTPAQ